jgi:Mg-chelatase subunit ChlD
MRWSGEGGDYYGLPQVSQRVLYVLDISDSMRQEFEGKSRLERCGSEVARAIKALPRSATFGLIVYNSEVRRFRAEMVPATPANKDAAAGFIAELRHANTTNIYDALRESFQMAGDGSKKKDTRVRVDTIFLLSDGAPTTPDAENDDVERILQAVREWNALGRVTIHTIGIGKDLKFSFLQALAEENGGTFVLKEW